jgi:hypothetical protein
MTVYYVKGCGILLARVTTISPLWLPVNRTFYAPFSIHQTDSCLCLIGIEAVKLAQARFGETSWLTPVWGSWKGKRDGDNKEVYFVDKISNSAGHK